MVRHLLVLVVVSCTSLSLAAPAQAQLLRRLFEPDDGNSGRIPRGSNRQLEEKKAEAQQAYQGDDFPRVIDLMDDVLRQNPRDSVAYYLRASARVELGARRRDIQLVREGIADSREAIRFDTQKTSMYYLPYLYGMKNLAMLENLPKHAETSVAIATQVLGVPGLSGEDKANLLFQRAAAEAWLKKPDEAVADFEEALRLVPTHFGARAAVAEVLAAAGRKEQATAAFNKLVESFPESPLSYNNRGMFYQHEGKYDDAIVDFTRAIEREPNYFYAYTNRGFTLLEMDKPDAAEADFSQSLKLNPQQPFLYNLRGLSKLARGNISGAIQDQRTSVNMSSRDPAAHGDLGFLLFFSGDFGGALQEFDAALAINSQMRQLIPWRIAALEHLGRTQDLKEQYNASLTKGVKQRDWIDNLVAYLLNSESQADLLAAATGAANETLKNDETCEAYYFMGVTDSVAGKTTEAQDAFQRAVATKSRRLSAYRGAQFALKKTNSTASTAPIGKVVPAAGSNP